MEFRAFLLASSLAASLCFGMPAFASPDPLLPSFLPRESLPFSKTQLASLARLSVESTHWEDIHGWRALGSRWAAGLDGSGRVLALFDLSMTDGLFSTMTARLGTLGGPNFNFQAVHDLLVLAANQGDPAGRKRAVQAIKALNLAHPDLSAPLLADDWAKQVPWKASVRAAFAGSPNGPAHFRLTDIDLDALVISRPLFRACLKYLHGFGIDLERLALSRNPDGSYALDLLAAEPAGPEAANEAAKASRPYLLADLHSVRSGFYDTISWMIAKSAIGFAIGLIPNPVVSALVGTSLDIFVRFRNEVVDLHREAAREMVAAAANGETYSAFTSLTPQELRNAGIWLYLAQTSFFTVWNWVFKGAEGAWRADLQSDLDRANEAHAWIAAHHAPTRELNPRFTLNTGDRKLYLLSHYRWLGSKQEPVPGIDYGHLENALILRAAVQSASTAIDFGSRFIPLVGGVVSTVWDWVITAPVHNTKDFEARLTAHLEERERISGEDWEYELAVLDRQRLNPFERTRAASRALIGELRRQLGIIPPGPQYDRPPEQLQSYSNALE